VRASFDETQPTAVRMTLAGTGEVPQRSETR
jgi:hypothetical protein